MSHTTSVTSIPFRSESALRAAVLDLQKQGIKCSLLVQSNPRMFYADQLQQHLGTKSENCDFVLKLDDSRYDIGFLRQADGTFLPIMDLWAGEIERVLGVPSNAKALARLTARPPHAPANWKPPTPEEIEAVFATGKLLSAYSKALTIETAVRAGHMVESCTVDQDGNTQLRLRTA